MKKSILGLIAVLSITLASCSMFESEPIEPKIIGVGKLQYDVVHGLYYVEFDSVRYSVATIVVPSKRLNIYSTLQDIPPVEGSKVTVFTSNRQMGVQAVIGEFSVVQIEDLFRTVTITIINVAFLIMLALAVWWFSIEIREWYEEKKAKRSFG